ncbi:MAG: RNA polymerase sigma factor [Chloroflexota bacterium]|jgi:RNA polymerase sigma factor (sigma-70 family)
MVDRTTEEWLEELTAVGLTRQRALADLRDYLFRAVLLYLRRRRSDLDYLADSDLRAMAQDFAQEATLSVDENLDSFRGSAKFTTWAYRFVINEAISQLRRRDYRKRLSLEGLSETETAVLMSLAERKAGRNPDLRAERQDMSRLLLEIIRSELNERQRLAVLGVYFEGHSIQETAEFLDTSPNTLYKMLYDARQKIKTRLRQLHLSEGDLLAAFEE